MLIRDRALSEEEMIAAINTILDGVVADAEIAAFLSSLHQRGETIDELTGAARAMRLRAQAIEAPVDAVDCCGTGGDGHHTYNVSTAVALVAAACGVPVAKHGNHAASSRSGAADVLEALGVNLDLTPVEQSAALHRFNFTFLLATKHHQAMRHVAAARKSLGHRTIFNLLGPLLNPANTRRQLIGVFDGRWLMPIAETLRRLGTERAWIVHGQDGVDEISVTAPTDIAILDEGVITATVLEPVMLDIPRRSLGELRGGDAAYNARALRRLLDGTPTAYRDIVLLNTAAVLALHGDTPDLRNGIQLAAEAIDSGAAAQILDRYRAFSQNPSA